MDFGLYKKTIGGLKVTYIESLYVLGVSRF